MAFATSTAFESAAAVWLTERVKVVAANYTPGRRGAVQEGAQTVVDGLKCSIQPRASLDSRTVLGRMPEMSHLMFCRAEDDDGTLLDIHKGDKVVESYDLTQNTARGHKPRSFVILSEPQPIIDPFTRGWHHLEMELREDLLG